MGDGRLSFLRSGSVVLLAVATLVGCSGIPQARDIGIASRSYRGLPAGVDQSVEERTPPPTDPPLVTLEPGESVPPAPAPDHTIPPLPDESPRALWLDEDTLALVTFGSSSCPSAPAALTVTAPGEVLVDLKRTGGSACTADMGPTTFEIDDPDGLDPSLTYTVSFDDASETVLKPLA